MKIGDEVYVHGYIDEIRNDTVIIRNAGGYIDETIEMLIPVSVLYRIMEEIDDEAECAYADFDEYKCDVLHAEPDELPDDDFRYGLRRAIEIINKYRAERS